MNRGSAPPPPEKPPSVAERTRLLKSSFRRDDVDRPKVVDKSRLLCEKPDANPILMTSSRIANGEGNPSLNISGGTSIQLTSTMSSTTTVNNVHITGVSDWSPNSENKPVNGVSNTIINTDCNKENSKLALNAAKRDAFFKNEAAPKFDPSTRFGMERERTREREIITKDVDNDRNEKHHREGHKELENYVGFANLPNQVYRKSVKRGFEFNLMVVGESGLGKSTLINSLFLTDLYSSEYPGPSLRIQKTVKVDTTQVLLKENGVSLRLTVVDTPGFGDAVDNSNCWQPVIDFIDTKYEEYLNSESRVNRTIMPDNRVHCCLYFIAPTGHGLKPLDVEFMKRLHDKVNIIPLVAKADTLTPDECRDFKKTILNEIAQHKIKIYEFPECDDEEENKLQKKLLKKDLKSGKFFKDRVPFAVVGSNTVIDCNGKRMRGRQYPWGIVEVENLEHNDFIALRNMLIRTHMQDLKDVTNNVHYENYRYSKLAPITADGKVKASLGKDPLTQMQEEKREHDAKMKKMEAEMEQVFEMKVKEKKTKLKDSEADLQRRAEQMKKSLEQQQKELDEKWATFEKEKSTWEEQMGERRRSLENTKDTKKDKKKSIF
ncbi:septin-7 isoform X2 [Octopus bimaculoides]|uniref:septin-7 isoform X2 n=1 Tax=Octopus bimaculoides TaxID=37653 RepID=UPI00071E4F98|nr:septin-7 isoform X2 [Octopus bimaculoides]|eukprot:XP_014776064.1 PREDICTED: septin-7-like isoform X2 [Octopus bimaculoides]